jgi:hypothetical protein
MSDRPKGDTAQIFSSDLKKLADTLTIISKTDTSDISSFWAQNLTSMRNSLEMTWHFKKFRFTKLLRKLNTLYSIRDIQNAQNLEWLIENRYKGEKIIVWAASIHVMHNVQSIKVRGLKGLLFNFRNFNNTGDIIRERYGNRSYTIGFTAFEGIKDNLAGNKKIEFRNGSGRNIEFQLNKLNRDYLFLNFDGNTLPAWLNKKMKSGICGYGNEISVIPATVDGLFFIRKMEAAEY